MGFKKIRRNWYYCDICGFYTTHPEVHICIGFKDNRKSKEEELKNE